MYPYIDSERQGRLGPKREASGPAGGEEGLFYTSGITGSPLNLLNLPKQTDMVAAPTPTSSDPPVTKEPPLGKERHMECAGLVVQDEDGVLKLSMEEN
jgi:hypothetical protein